jgi:hemoglobin
VTDPLLPAPDTEVAQHRSLPRAGTAGPAASDADVTPDSVYDRVGGEPFFTRLVDAFYDRVAEDDVLRPLYPEQDLGPARIRLRMFLVQYWGGPSTYSEQRGHPRLRMRHAPFGVGTAQIASWLQAMRGALDEVQPDPEVEAELWGYFLRSAPFMRNVED